jgi:micrococcal nuclease
MKITVFLLIVFAGFNTVIKANNEITAKVVSVIDGNTIEIESPENGRQRVVFAGIDSPELEQEFGGEAKLFTEKMLLQKEVTVDFRGKDSMGNYVAIVLIGDDDPRVQLLKEGLAWIEVKNNDSELAAYFSWAQKKLKGLWKNENSVPPWVFRRQQTMIQPKSS